MESPTSRTSLRVSAGCGRDGVLDAAGVIYWSADPNLRGPVEPYVRGYGPRRR
jgi:hypothetical protein